VVMVVERGDATECASSFSNISFFQLIPLRCIVRQLRENDSLYLWILGKMAENRSENFTDSKTRFRVT
jgi:hypothetical protein